MERRLQGYITTTYDALIKVFGVPRVRDNSIGWRMTAVSPFTGKSMVVMIFTWNETFLNMGPNVSDWLIVGTNPDVIGWVLLEMDRFEEYPSMMRVGQPMNA